MDLLILVNILTLSVLTVNTRLCQQTNGRVAFPRNKKLEPFDESPGNTAIDSNL